GTISPQPVHPTFFSQPAVQLPNKTPPGLRRAGFSFIAIRQRVRRCALQPRRRAQGVDLVGLFPAEGNEGVVADGLLLRDTSEVTIGRGFLAHRAPVDEGCFRRDQTRQLLTICSTSIME